MFYAERDNDHLIHYGIKGQKWGVRRFENPDGTLTPEGRERYGSEKERKKLATAVEKTVVRRSALYASKHELSKASKQANKVEKHPVVREAVKKVQAKLKAYKDADNDYTEQTNAFYNNKKLYEKYLNKAVDLEMKSYGAKEGLSRKEVYDMFKYDDLDQGESSSIELYKRSSEGKKLMQADRRASEAREAYRTACEKYASEYLGAYGNKTIAAYGDWQRNISSRLSDIIERAAEKTN